MLSRYVMGSALSISLLVGAAIAQPALVQNAFGLQVVGTPKEPPKRFALSAGRTNDPAPFPPDIGFAFVVGRDSPPTGGSAQIKLQRIDHAGQQGTLGWSVNLPLQPGQTDADGISVITDQEGTKVFVTGWYKTGTGRNIIVMGYDGNGNALWPAPFTYSNPGVTGDDVPVQIEWDQFGTLVGDPSLDSVYVGGTSEGVATGATLGKDIVVFKLKATDGTPFNANWNTPFHFNGAGNGPDTFSELSVQHRRCFPPGESGGFIDYNRVFVGGTSYQGLVNKNDYVILSIDGATAVAAPATLYNSPNNGDDVLTSLDAFSAANSLCEFSGAVAVTGYSNGTVPGDGSDDYVTIAYPLNLAAPLWGGALGPTRVYDGADSLTTQGSDRAVAVKTGADSGSVIVTGSTWGGTGEGFNVATIKYDLANGVRTWVPFLPAVDDGVAFFNNTAANAEDQATDLVVDKNDNIYIGGFSFTGTSKDYFAISYLGFDGARRWTLCSGGQPVNPVINYVTAGGVQNGADATGSIRVSFAGGEFADHIGDVYLYGLFTNNGNQFTIVKYRQNDDEDGCPQP